MTQENIFDINDYIKSYDLLKTEIESISDRSCAIVCAAFLDEFLERLLLSFLTNASSTQDDLLTKHNGPLSTFSSKIRLAYRLGLISKKEYDCLNLVRNIRNKFAHDLKISDFECTEIKKHLLGNIPSEKMLPPISIPITLDDNGNPLTLDSELFVKVVTDENLYHSLVSKFPKIEFIELKKHSMRSIFTCIVYILQACLASRLYCALLNQRQQAKDYDDIVEIEETKITSMIESKKSQVDKLMRLKKNTEDDIKNIDETLKTCIDKTKLASINKYKRELTDHLNSINELLEEISKPLSVEEAFSLHTYRLLKHQLSTSRLGLDTSGASMG